MPTGRGRSSEPVGQKRFTNVAAVRLKVSANNCDLQTTSTSADNSICHGAKTSGSSSSKSRNKITRFEVACYKNVVEAYRSGAETDLDDVLQSTTVFTNLSKGIVASAQELLSAFGTCNLEDVCRIILEKGQLQVSDKERSRDYETMFRDVVNIIVEKSINPQTKRPYTYGVLERVLRDLHVSVDLTRSAKVQSLELIPVINSKIPIVRARMKLRVEVVLANVDRSTLNSSNISHTSGDSQHKLEPRVKKSRRRKAKATGARENLSGIPIADEDLGTCGAEKSRQDQKPIRRDELVRFFEESFDAEILLKSDVQGDLSKSSNEGTREASGGNRIELAVLVFLIEPNHFRQISQFIQSAQGRVEVLEVATLEDMEVSSIGEAKPETVKEQANVTRMLEENFKGLDICNLAETHSSRATAISTTSKLKCTTCQCSFVDTKEHREHFKSDLHRINIKRKLRKQDPICADECNAMMLMMTEEDNKYNIEMDEYM